MSTLEQPELKTPAPAPPDTQPPGPPPPPPAAPPPAGRGAHAAGALASRPPGLRADRAGGPLHGARPPPADARRVLPLLQEAQHVHVLPALGRALERTRELPLDPLRLREPTALGVLRGGRQHDPVHVLHGPRDARRWARHRRPAQPADARDQGRAHADARAMGRAEL